MIFHRFSKLFGYEFLDTNAFIKRFSSYDVFAVGEAVLADVPKAVPLDANCVEAPELLARKIQYEATYVYRLQRCRFPQVRILSNGAILLQQKTLLSSGLGPEDASIVTALRPDRRRLTRIEKYIVAPFPHNWSHGTYGDYVVRILPRIARVLERVDLVHRKNAVIAYPLFNTPFEKAFLTGLGFSDDQIVDTHTTRVECAGDGVIYCPSGEDSGWSGRSAHPSDYRAARKAFQLESNSPAGSNRRLYLRRTGRRRILNENEILPILSENGFEAVDLGALSVPEQIKLCSQASVILGIQGANLTNMLWCRRSAVLIELFGRGFRPVFHRQMAFSLGLNYFYWADSPLEKSDFANVNWDLTCDVSILKIFLESLEGSGVSGFPAA